MPQPRKIYLLDPRFLSPETIAVAFAKTSRSPQSFREIAHELSDEKSADFHEKWVVGYGHSSVAEHAVLHIALENVSRLSVECIESNRLASYTEKSSRYQIWDQEHFYVPEELDDIPLREEYIVLNKHLFRNYQSAIEKVTDHLKIEQPCLENESERAFMQRVRTCSADVCRYYLPASALANVGMTINARALEHAIAKLLSHPLIEVQNIGKEVKFEAQKIVPTLVKYANENAYIKESYSIFNSYNKREKYSTVEGEDWFKCIDCDADGEERILAALLFRYGNKPFEVVKGGLNSLTQIEKENIAADLFERLGEHDIPLRELELASISFDLILDQGAFFELKRHRMMSQSPQDLNCQLGYAVPSLIKDSGIAELFIADMNSVKEFFEKLYNFNANIASYIVPNAFNRRVLLHMNLRSAYHFIKLRSAPNAHFAIRRVALKIADAIKFRYPLFAKYFQPETDESWQSISSEFFDQVV